MTRGSSSGSPRPSWKMIVWIALALVLAGSLVIGASHRGGPVTPAQRAASLDAQLRCPSCNDVSVADSSAASAVAIRQLVLADAKAGVSDQAIVSYLQSRYPGIELRPSTSGLQGIVWFAPVIAFGFAVAMIGRLFWRKRSTPAQVHLDDADRLLVADALRAAREPGAPRPADKTGVRL